MGKPNLFNYATSELSHDAFIAWLISWADLKNEGYQLSELGCAILMKFFDLAQKEMPEIKKVEVHTQSNNIDVLIELTTTTKPWVIIIEDKIYTSQHSDQLKRYKEEVPENIDDITEDRIIGIYYKMWEQSDLKKVKDSDYHHFSRKMMLDILESYDLNGESDILDNYYSYLRKMQENLEAYKTKQVVEWKRSQWIGFYSEVKKDLNEGNLGYVSNSSGGFFAFWFGAKAIVKEDKINVEDEKREVQDEIYVQIEQDKLCFKVHTHKYKERKAAKWFWNKKIIGSAKLKNLDVIKPPVMRMGEYCTVGILNSNKTDYWMSTDQNELIDYEKSLNVLKKAQEVVEIASKKEPDYKK